MAEENVGREATPEEVAKIEAERAAAREDKTEEEIAAMDAEEKRLADEVNARIEREEAAKAAAEKEKEEEEAEKVRAEEKEKEAQAKKDAEEKGAAVNEGTISVYNANGAFVRSYTEEMSDDPEMENAKTNIEKAEGYAKKIDGTVRMGKK